MSITGQQLRAARKAAGMTQEAMGAFIGVTGKTISNLEKRRVIPEHYYFAAVTVVRAGRSGMAPQVRASADLEAATRAMSSTVPGRALAIETSSATLTSGKAEQGEGGEE